MENIKTIVVNLIETEKRVEYSGDKLPAARAHVEDLLMHGYAISRSVYCETDRTLYVNLTEEQR